LITRADKTPFMMAFIPYSGLVHAFGIKSDSVKILIIYFSER